jgi:hypothetical protein
MAPRPVCPSLLSSRDLSPRSHYSLWLRFNIQGVIFFPGPIRASFRGAAAPYWRTDAEISDRVSWWEAIAGSGTTGRAHGQMDGVDRGAWRSGHQPGYPGGGKLVTSSGVSEPGPDGLSGFSAVLAITWTRRSRSRNAVRFSTSGRSSSQKLWKRGEKGRLPSIGTIDRMCKRYQSGSTARSHKGLTIQGEFVMSFE